MRAYEKYWNLIKQHRWKREEARNPNYVISFEVPNELQWSFIKAIRNEKWREQYETGRNYGKLFSYRKEGRVDFKLVPPAIERI